MRYPPVAPPVLKHLNPFFMLKTFFLSLAVLTLLASTPVAAQNSGISLDPTQGSHAGELMVPINKSQVLKIDQPFSELFVGNSKIADVLPLTNRSVYILGKEIGSTNLSIYGPEKNLIAVADLVVTYDVGGLKAKLFEILPQSDIEVRTVNGSVYLAGTLASAGQVNKAVEIAERYAPDAVTNALSVSGTQQVLLQVKFAEINRTTSRGLGISQDVTGSSEDIGITLLSGASLANAFLTSTFSIPIGAFTLDFMLDALEEKGLVRLLAEPNLISLSGDTANFLAGGEFPFPISNDDDGLTIQFKEFGVGLSFTPTVLDDGLINLLVAPEVSQLDRTNGITIDGVTVPGLTTRRAMTTVELRDGQSFAIAGLLQNNYENSIEQFPWLGNVPVLGALFRSSQFEQNQTELVIIVTPRLVVPAKSPNQLTTPDQYFSPPSDEDLFLYGRQQAFGPAAPEATAFGGDGGLAGSYGHILK